MRPISAFFAAELIAAYPDAQVVLWERDVDEWEQSFDNGVLKGFGFASPVAMFFWLYVTPFSGVYWPTTQWYGNGGWLRAKDYRGMRANMRDRYKEHFATVRAMTKPDKLLEYRLGDGWEPICKFLGVPVPDKSFPHLNERDALKKVGTKMLTDVLLLAVWNMLKYPLLLGAAGVLMSWGYNYAVY